MKQIELLAATTPSNPAPDLPSGFPSPPAGLEEGDDALEPGWVAEDSGTLFKPRKNDRRAFADECSRPHPAGPIRQPRGAEARPRSGRDDRCADYSGAKMASQSASQPIAAAVVVST